jgi:tetratricopeptide (TPR) repeat protein
MNWSGWLVLVTLITLIATVSPDPALAHDNRVVLAASPETLGRVHFAISCSPAAQEQFDRALAMLHSFWFPPTTQAFTAITQSEPDCAMAHWGVAMSQRGNPLLGAPARGAMETGRAAIEKARTLGAKTQPERDYIAALETYFKDWETVDHPRRVLAYEKAMEDVHLRYPTDPEAATLYALALNEAIMVLPADKTYARHLKAAGILERVLATHPDHPGALHYLIHSYDFPPLASRGLPAARRYDAVASSAPHALHMPSHIYSMVGMWPESITANLAALAVAKTYVHAMDFAVYAYLQGAQDAAAKRMAEEAAALLKAQAPAATLTPTAGVLAVHTAVAAIPARLAIERGAWMEAAALQPHPSTPAADAITHFTRAMGAARNGDVTSARKDIEQLVSLRDTLRGAKQEYWVEQVEIQRRAASAWVAQAEGKKNEALQLMRSAADLEDASEKHVAMENRLWPMRELLGELLLESNQPARALEEFEVSLKTSRNRLRGLYGAARASELSGNREKARGYYDQILTLTRGADSERVEIQRAKAFVGTR